MRKLLFVVLGGLMVSCATPEEKPDFKQSQRALIKKLEGEAIAAEMLDSALVTNLGKAYLHYADSFPQDSITPYYLMKAGDVFRAQRQTALTAVVTYNRLLEEHPRHASTPKALFMIGFTFDELLGDKERAAKTYSHFLKEYPNHELAYEAKMLLALASDTGRTELDIIAEWEAKNRESKAKKLQ